MPGVTEREIAQAKQMKLYQYMQLCEPDNFKPEGPGQFRHKGHSSLSFAENGTWTYFICLDNDEAGRTRTQEITKHLAGSGKTVQDRAPPLSKDYNDIIVRQPSWKKQRLTKLWRRKR